MTGPLLEAGIGPAVITGGFVRGDEWLKPWPNIVFGCLLAGAGIAVIVWCYARFVTGNGTPSPLSPPSDLVGGGPYAVIRNPMYVATAAVIAGEGFIIARPVLIVCAAIYLGAMAALVVKVEEPLLAERFGPRWDAYREAVPGWVPRRAA